VQAQILNLLLALQAERRLAYVFISHNVSVTRHFCDEVAVMYLGQIVEQSPAAAVFGQSSHPFACTLLEAVPKIGQGRASARLDKTDLPPGCFFRNRCPGAGAGCDLPQTLHTLPCGHLMRCHREAP
jgi:peptide/nickel transport system ATP-binding protein